MKNTLLKVQNLEVTYRTRNSFIKAVEDVTLEVGVNECVALIGESGSGKSTIAKAILRILPENATISHGQIIFKNKNLLSLTEKEMRKMRGKEISMVFQEPHSCLNPVLKIGDQLIETIKTHNPNLMRKEILEKAVELLSVVRIPDPQKILNRYPHQLSGGMAQRVAIALALSSNPSLVIADEPTSSLDLTVQAQIIKLLKKLMEMFKISILLITHDLSLVSNIADKVYVMHAGKIVEEDLIERLYKNSMHPYTTMLFEAVKKLQGISTSFNLRCKPESPLEPIGCKFANKCPLVKPICFQKPPPFLSIITDKKVLCWLYAHGDENGKP